MQICEVQPHEAYYQPSPKDHDIIYCEQTRFVEKFGKYIPCGRPVFFKDNSVSLDIEINTWCKSCSNWVLIKPNM